MAAITRFEEIEAWQTARQLANVIYEMTDRGSFAKDFGLKDQIRRAAVSVMSNIAEGFESHTQALFIDFLGRAKGSAGEVRSQLYLALDRHYLTQSQFDEAYRLAERVSRQIYGFMSYLKFQPNTRRVREEQIEYTFDSSRFKVEG
jgi:four helix bundle protein